MSHIDVHLITTRARERGGATYLRATQTRQLNTQRLADWQLNRPPFHHTLPPWGVPQDLKLERDQAEAAIAAAPRAPAAPRAQIGAYPVPAETLSWSWYAIGVLGGNDGYATTPQIPWPYRVIGFTFDEVNPGVGELQVEYQLFDTDGDYNGNFPSISGAPLIPFIGNIGAASPIIKFGPMIAIFQPAAAENTSLMKAMASAALGCSVLTAGRRLAIGIRVCAGANQDFMGSVTIERLPEAAMDFRTIEPRAPAPRAAAPASRAGATPAASPALAQLPQLTRPLLVGVGGARPPSGPPSTAPTSISEAQMAAGTAGPRRGDAQAVSVYGGMDYNIAGAMVHFTDEQLANPAVVIRTGLETKPFHRIF